MNGKRAPRASWWECWWARLSAVGQALLGGYIVLYELRAGTDRPYLLTLAAVLILGAPATSVGLQILSRALRDGVLRPPYDGDQAGGQGGRGQSGGGGGETQ